MAKETWADANADEVTDPLPKVPDDDPKTLAPGIPRESLIWTKRVLASFPDEIEDEVRGRALAAALLWEAMRMGDQDHLSAILHIVDYYVQSCEELREIWEQGMSCIEALQSAPMRES